MKTVKLVAVGARGGVMERTNPYNSREQLAHAILAHVKAAKITSQ